MNHDDNLDMRKIAEHSMGTSDRIPPNLKKKMVPKRNFDRFSSALKTVSFM